MKNIIISFVFVSMMGFYANAIAFVISDDTDYGSIPRDLIMQFIADGKLATSKSDRKPSKMAHKSLGKIDKLSLKDELNNKQWKKQTKHKKRIVALLNGMLVPDKNQPGEDGDGMEVTDPSDQISDQITETIISEGDFPTEKLIENQPDGNVPEPSVLALLGLGLAGLGVARRFKRTA